MLINVLSTGVFCYSSNFFCWFSSFYFLKNSWLFLYLDWADILKIFFINIVICIQKQNFFFLFNDRDSCLLWVCLPNRFRTFRIPARSIILSYCDKSCINPYFTAFKHMLLPRHKIFNILTSQYFFYKIYCV